MTYKKRFVNSAGVMSPISGANSARGSWNDVLNQEGNQQNVSFRNYMSRLPEVYVGHPNRIERYNQYEMMDVDAEINACLDIIAEFSTMKNEHNKTPFMFEFKEEPTPHEVEILKTQLQQWCKLNEFDIRVFKIFRNVIKYGDQIFVRDPENFKLYWVDMVKIIKVIVNESEGKKPEQYVIKDLNINLQNLSVAQKTNTDFAANPATGLGGTGGGTSTPYTVPAMPYNTTGSRFTLGQSEASIDSSHIVHLSLTEGLDRFWPFGQSILENIFKVYKQKELLEDAVLIYRVQRAPERRVFKIDVGDMPSHMAMAYVEHVKNEIHQRRIPSAYGGSSVVDASYSPLSIGEDYYFPISCLTLDTKIPLLDSRTLTLRELINEFASGKENWVYSINQKTFKMEPGKISWAGVTRKNAELVEVTLDNNEILRTTPDHRFIMRDGSEKEAQYLQSGDSLMPLYLHESKTSPKQKGKPYVRYVDNRDGKIKCVHTTICPKTKTNTVIHHKDCNSKNNIPTNLVEMDKNEHIALHKSMGTYSISKQWSSVAGREKLVSGIRKYHANKTAEDTKMIVERNRKNAIAGFTNMTEETYDNWRKKSTVARHEQDLKLEYSNALVECLLKIAKENKNIIHTLDDLRVILVTNIEFMSIWKKDNAHRCGKHASIDNALSMFSEVRIRELFRLTEYKTWYNFAKKEGITFPGCHDKNSNLNRIRYEQRIIDYNANPVTCLQCGENFEYSRRMHKFCDTSCSTTDNNLKGILGKRTKTALHNHKVLSIKFLDIREDTGDITVEGNHNFATEAGVYVHNSDGRGSSVELLPGGTALGEIDDLKYFNNRLARGLRVPSSYLPTGPDDSQTPLSDGRVGTAMIQEFRFNQYCERLQSYIALKLDEEFKIFLRWRGFNIDSGLFTLRFNPPQNFAAYRQSELDTARVSSFSQMEALPYMSKRFAMERFLGLTEEEIAKNEKQWREENNKEEDKHVQGQDLRNIGVSVSDLHSDQSTAEDMANQPGEESEIPGPEIAGPVSSAPGAAMPGGAEGGAPPA